MDEAIKPSEVQRIGGLELNLLNYVQALPESEFEGARLETGTPVYDMNGALLFYRIPIAGPNGGQAGYADVAAHTVFGAPLLGVAPSVVWDEQSLVGEARKALGAAQEGRKGATSYDDVRFAPYSYAHLAMAFFHN